MNNNNIQMKWDPEQYLKFSDERFRPAYDLIEQIHFQSPELIYDLGCGTGHITNALSTRWPAAKIIGIDSSGEMLDAAKKSNSTIQWLKEDINKWTPSNAKPDIIFSNSTLHWLKNHKVLFGSLLSTLKSKGILAIQMPNNFKEPTHTTALKIVKDNPEWNRRLLPFINSDPIHTINFYYDIFANSQNIINLWETTYFHILSGSNPVTEWVKGSFLRPLLEQMPPPDQTQFLKKYNDEIMRHYPAESDGKTILPFKRIFLLITKP